MPLLASSSLPGLPLRTEPHAALDLSRPTSAVVCGNAHCSSGWRKLWKDRRRPIFEGRWACSERCMQDIVAAAVRREGPEVRTADPYRHRIPLGLVLLAQGLITHPQLRHALEAQRRSGSGRIGSWLVEEFGLEQGYVTRALSTQWSCPVWTTAKFDPAAMALALPRIFVEELGLVPLRITARRTLHLGFENGMDAASAFALERMCGLKVESGLVDATELAAARTRLLASEFVAATVERPDDEAEMCSSMVKALARHQPRSARLVRMHGFYWMRLWLDDGAREPTDGGLPLTHEDVVDCIYHPAGRTSRVTPL